MEEAAPSPHGVSTLVTHFDVSQNGFAWRAPRPEQIMDRRAAMDDKLIFDMLLITGGIRDPDFLYPPRDAEGLERLLKAIDTSAYDSLKKHTLVYYLLKWHQDGRENVFKVQFSIPPQFAALADAYWYLDSGLNVAKAVSILSDARLNNGFSSKIIHAITLSSQPGPLVIKYVRTAKPQLVQPPDMLRYIVALAESGVFEAWQYQRSFSESHEMRPRLFRQIIDWALSPTLRSGALKTLISLPLSHYEQELLNNHALKPPPEFDATTVAILQDLVCVRYVEHGKYIDAIKMDRKFSAAGFDKQETSDRKSMIRELYESLSPVEKTLVEADITPVRTERQRPAPPTPAPVVAQTPGNLSQSWEEVPVPENLNKSTNTPLRNIQIPPTPPSIAQPVFTPTATAPVASGSAVPAPPPLLLGPGASQSISANGFTPRKSGPLSALGKGRPSMSGVAQRMALSAAAPGVSSPVSGMRFPVGSAKPPSATASPAAPIKFVSTVNQANAFYQPKPTAQKRPLSEDEGRVEDGRRDKEPVGDLRDMEVDKTSEPEQEPEEEVEEPVIPPWQDDGAATELTHSIFGNGPGSSEGFNSAVSGYGGISGRRETRRTSRASYQPQQNGSGKPGADLDETPKKKTQPPGAFDDAHGEDEEDEPEPPVPKPRAMRRKASQAQAAPRATTRASAHEAASASPVKPVRKTRQIKQKDLGRSIPGGLMDDEDDHDQASVDGHGDEEEEDGLGPLPVPRPPTPPVAKPRKAPAVRKTKSVASVSEAGSDGEGPSTRRRSSRLTGTSSVSNLSPEAAAPVKGKKTSRASTTKRKK